jgi:hypothetical protein
MKIGPFWFDSKEMFLVLAAILVALSYYFHWSIPFFDQKTLFVLIVLFLTIKGLLPSIHNENFLILGIITVFLSLYLSLFQIVLFFFVSLILFRVLRVF